MSRLFRARPPDHLADATLAVQLSALLLLIDVMQVWYLRALLILLVGLGLLYPFLLRTPGLWLGIAVLEAARVVRLWPTGDDYQYLLAYWSLAIFIALCLPDPRKSLEVSGRWLLVALFFWTALWKVLSPDYLDGRHYTVRLLADGRYQETTQILAGLSASEIREKRDALAPPFPEEGADLAEPAPDGTPIGDGVRVPSSYSRLVTVLTWGMLLFELALALAFLLPWGRGKEWVRHGLLMSFCIVIYALAPVRGFGPLILILGLAQVPREQWTLRTTYVVVWFLILFLTEIPRSHLISALRTLGVA